MYNHDRRGGICRTIHQGGIPITRLTPDGNLRQRTPVWRGILEVPVQDARQAAKTIITIPHTNGWIDGAPERSNGTVPAMIRQLSAGRLVKMAILGRIRSEQPDEQSHQDLPVLRQHRVGTQDHHRPPPASQGRQRLRPSLRATLKYG